MTGPPDGLAVVFQEYGRSLFPWLRVRDNVDLPLRAGGMAQGEAARAGRRGARRGRTGRRALRVPVAALRRHAAAGGDRPRDRLPATGAADGRAVRGRRRADPRGPRGPDPVGVAAARRDAAVRHPRHRRVGLPRTARGHAVRLADHGRRGPHDRPARQSATSSARAATRGSPSCAAGCTRRSRKPSRSGHDSVVGPEHVRRNRLQRRVDRRARRGHRDRRAGHRRRARPYRRRRRVRCGPARARAPRPRSGTGPPRRSRNGRPYCAGRACSSRQQRRASCGTGWSGRPARCRGWPTSRSASPRRSATRPRRSPPQPTGQILPTNQPRLSLLRRVPVGVVGVISPFNVPLILSIRSVAPALALGNAVVLKPDLRTPVSGGFAIARVFEEAGLPDGLLHVLPGGADAGTALVTDPPRAGRLVHRLHRDRPQGRRAGRAAPQARAPGARRQLGAGGARRRRPRPRGVGRRVGLVPAPGPDLHDRRAGTSCTRGSPTPMWTRSPRTRTQLPVGDPFGRRGRARPADRRGPARQGARARHGHRGRRRPARGRRHATTGCSTGRPCWTRCAPTCRRTPRRSSARSRRWCGSRTDDEAVAAGRRQRATACRCRS